jgi:ABC-type branched-subunit amino acid transport system substrate-binding protein
MIGPIAGAPDLRTPWIQNVINIRASVADETKHLVNYMTTSLYLVRVVALWSNDITGVNGLQALNNSLRAKGIKLLAHASYPTDTGNIDQAFSTINSTISSLSQAPQAIFLFGTQTVPPAHLLE